MTYAPATLKTLAAYWVAQGGVDLGIVGDAPHAAGGTSYHLGKDQLVAGAYSARTARDKAGLTNAASAIDLGRLNTTLTDLWTFSRWFAQRCFDQDPAYRDVREVIFWSPVRERVIGWSDLSSDQWIADYGDLSHKTHTHISFYRDSEARPKVALFRPYWEETVKQWTAPPVPTTVTVKAGTVLYRDLALTIPGPTLTADRDQQYYGSPAPGVRLIERVGQSWFIDGDAAVPDTSKPACPAPTPDATACKPFTDAAVTADRAKARIVYT